MSQCDLQRFKAAQDKIYHRVINELTQGVKQSHWMWYIFPQIAGLGQSSTAIHYAIQNIEEAKAYLDDCLLSGRLHECCKLLLQIPNKSAVEILGRPDDLKLRSSMTLFASVSQSDPLFMQVLQRYYDGSLDQRTLKLCGK